MRMFELKNKIGIYKLSFDDSPRVYIGQSINLMNRIKYHKVLLKKNEHYNPKLQRSYNKYGNLKFEILEFLSEIDSKKLNELELFYINKFDSFKNGLNCTIGGDYFLNKSTKEIFQYDAKTGDLIQSCFGYMNFERKIGVNESNIRQICNGTMKTAKGFHFSLFKKTPEEVLNDVKSKIYSEEYKNKMSKLMSGEGNGMYGKKHSETTLKKMSEKSKNQIRPRKLDFDLVIKLYTEDNMTQKEIAKLLNCSQPSIGTILLKNGIRSFTKKKIDNEMLKLNFSSP